MSMAQSIHINLTRSRDEGFALEMPENILQNKVDEVLIRKRDQYRRSFLVHSRALTTHDIRASIDLGTFNNRNREEDPFGVSDRRKIDSSSVYIQANHSSSLPTKGPSKLLLDE